MRRWSRGNRRMSKKGQTQPLAAIIAVFAVCVGLVTYTGVLGDATPNPERNIASTILSDVREIASSNGVVEPRKLSDGMQSKPDGKRLNISLSLRSRSGTTVNRWHVGPPVPANADTAETVVSVRTAPGRIRPARLHIGVW
ncbi:DUF7285 family protein [Haladaptatus caseinilyticus]|uniref:DUF7285 family protein n=1 Tax=Haladaptatus caseinilyticus TaxID=2993314 RepID=UPI00224B6678|nr:hypothetical protein [Haladaptatus caseinilyticus]